MPLPESFRNRVVNNTASSNKGGIYLGESFNNTLLDNMANSNSDVGPFLYKSSKNLANNNEFCGNSFKDLFVVNDAVQSNGSNICDTRKVSGSNPIGCKPCQS